MNDRTLFPAASTRATFAYCWRQMRPDRATFVVAWVAVATGTLANAVAGPLIFAVLLGRIADLSGRSGLVASFGPLIVAYAAVLAVSTLLWRVAGWLELGRDPARLRSLHHQWLRAPDRAQPPVAHRPAVRGGHLLVGDILVGLRRDHRHGHLGSTAGQRDGPRRHRGTGPGGLAGRGGDGPPRPGIRWGPLAPDGEGGGRRAGVLGHPLARPPA